MFAKANTTDAVDKPELYRADFFRVQANLLAADSTVAIRYDATGKPFTTTTVTSYRQQRPVRSTVRDSHGNLRINAITYLCDYSPTLPNFARLQAHNFNPIIEVQHWLRPVSRTDSLVTGGELTLYDAQWQRPAGTFKLDVVPPQIGFNARQTTNGYLRDFLSDTRYRRVATEYYDPIMGDPIGQQLAHAPATTYVWGYGHTLPIAQVQNALPTQVAYAGFEVSELGRWQGDLKAIKSPGYTGLAGYDLAAGLQCSGLPAGKYELSCRQNGTSSLFANGQELSVASSPVRGWTEYSAQITIGQDGLVRLTGTGHLDEVRLYPIGARMTSYTHEPLVGESSVTDPTGRTIFYEYDGLGRLVRTRDEQGRILSQQQYHYAGK